MHAYAATDVPRRLNIDQTYASELAASSASRNTKDQRHQRERQKRVRDQSRDTRDAWRNIAEAGKCGHARDNEKNQCVEKHGATEVRAHASRGRGRAQLTARLLMSAMNRHRNVGLAFIILPD